MLERIDLDDGAVLWLDARWLGRDEETALTRALEREVPWAQRSIRIAGKTYLQPRLTAWYGDPGTRYTYSGLTLDPMPWTATLAALRDRLERDAGAPFNSALLNLYRDGRDAMGFHADDEPELGPSPVIASISLGAPRRFVLAHKKKKGARFELSLGHGALLVMAGATQHAYRHGVPRQARAEGPRVNLTFRRIFAPDADAG